MKMLCFDMDGTIADFYAVENWRDKLHAEDASPYEIAAPLWDMVKLRDVLLKLSALGWEIRVISWLARGSSNAYKNAVRAAKLDWLKRYNFPVHKAHLVAYGTTKADCVRRLTNSAILIDDNEKVRQGWHLGDTIDPTSCDLIAELEKLVKESDAA